jgi:hypothetical protein
VADAGADE